MNATDEILSSIDPAQLAAALGTDEETARTAAAAAIPTLINGFQANAGTADGESGLLAALEQHAGSDLFGDVVNLDDVDTADGQKIVAHSLAGDPNRLQAVGGLNGDLLSKLLPLLAPIVMNYLAKKLGMGQAASPSGGSGSILGDLLGGILGGGLGGAGGAAGGGLGDILGQILGGGQAAPAAPSDYDTGYADDTSGGVFNAPGNPTGMQIPTDGTSDQQYAPQGSGNVLGDLLGQILGGR